MNDSYYDHNSICIINAYMNNHKRSIHCDEASNDTYKYTYIVADGVRTDVARIYALRKKLP